jgi:hypothetical protein
MGCRHRTHSRPLFTLVDTSPRGYDAATHRGVDGIDWKAALAAARAAWGQATGPAPTSAAPVAGLERLVKANVAAGVGETLFREYAEHRLTDRAAEEIGWLLLGLRETNSATVLATLPAGTERDAGEEHVRFHAAAQAVGGRILRRTDKRLVPLGVAHTHPGTLRHPSRGDFRGDREWVPNLRGRDGVFAIGTVDEPQNSPVSVHLTDHVHVRGGLRWDWYALAAGDEQYRPLPTEWTLGPDLGAELRSAWPSVEYHAERIENLCRTLQGVVVQAAGDAVVVTVPRPEHGAEIKIILAAKRAAFVYSAGGRDLVPDLPADTPADVGAFLLLAELAGQA